MIMAALELCSLSLVACCRAGREGEMTRARYRIGMELDEVQRRLGRPHEVEETGIDFEGRPPRDAVVYSIFLRDEGKALHFNHWRRLVEIESIPREPTGRGR